MQKQIVGEKIHYERETAQIVN